MEILKVLRKNPEIGTLEEAFKRAPELTVKMLHFLNSASIGLRSPIQSIKHAINMFGRGKLERWLSLMLYARSQTGTVTDVEDSPLLDNAAQRAVLMESLARQMEAANRELHDKAYLTGIMSRLDVLLSRPMEDILRQFKLDPEVNGAILEQAGILGRLLELAILQEEDQIEQVQHKLEGLKISPDLYRLALLDSYKRLY
jgi:EAL and modified HD-GYP domain-containing signal transduction protein